jgi:hypothetical protein
MGGLRIDPPSFFVSHDPSYEQSHKMELAKKSNLPLQRPTHTLMPPELRMPLKSHCTHHSSYVKSRHDKHSVDPSLSIISHDPQNSGHNTSGSIICDSVWGSTYYWGNILYPLQRVVKIRNTTNQTLIGFLLD